MNKTFRFLSILLVVITVIFIIPIKFAVTEGDIENSDKQHIICKQTAVTGFSWLKTGDENGELEYPELLRINGEEPLKLKEAQEDSYLETT